MIMPKHAILLFHILCLLLLHSLSASAGVVTAPLSQYMTSNEPLMLRNAEGSYSLSVPISDRIKPLSASLNLALTHSNVLKANRSQFVVYVNDYMIGQIKLDAINHNTVAKFDIGPEYLQAGYNKITFKAAQHYTDTECEDWGAPELWTTIDAVKSTLTLNYEAVDVTEKLSALNELINDRLGRYALTILRSDMAVSDHYLYWGAMISQAVKLRLKYIPLQLEEKTITASGNPNGGFAIDPGVLKTDAVLVGTKTQIASLLPNKINEAIQGPYLGIYRQDHDKTHFILVVSGNNDEQVNAAVQALALLNTRFPDQQQSIFEPPVLPDAEQLVSPGQIVPDNAYAFSQLDYQNQMPQGAQAQLRLRLPANLYSTEDSRVTLNLNLAYGAAMRKDSVINLFLNDDFVHAIQLKEPEGAHYQNYQVTLPLRSFRGGLNVLRFKAELTPSETGKCTYVQRNNLIANIYPDSTIHFPDAGHVAQLPDLKLFAATGFPLTQNASAQGTVFKLLDTSADSVAAAWQVIAHLAALQHAPIFDVKLTQGDIGKADNIALIGKLNDMRQAGALFDAAPVKLGEHNRFPYAFKESQITVERPLLARLDTWLFGEKVKPEPVTINPANVSLDQTGGLGQHFLLMSYPNPQGKGVVLALLSTADNSLGQGVSVLQSPSLWSQLQGSLFLWDSAEHFQWSQAGPTFTYGDGNLRLTWTLHFSRHPWQWLLVLSLFLFGAAWVTHVLLNKYQRRKN